MSKLAKALSASAGNAGGDKLYVEDVFSTYLYTGNSNYNSTNQYINNGIALSDEGGLVWLKTRGSLDSHALINTVNGPTKRLSSNSTDAEADVSTYFSYPAAGTTGFNVLKWGFNLVNATYASWSFRKAEKFFDIQTWTGNDVQGREISHALGSTPGCIICKDLTNASANWIVYNLGTGATKATYLNTAGGAVTASLFWDNTAPTDSVFTIGDFSSINASGRNYVAYLFASDAGGFGDDGDESIVKCGIFTGTASTLASVNLGFEPQFIIIKSTSDGDNWRMYDDMRGWSTATRELLTPNTAAAGSALSNTSGYDLIPTATGFDHKGHDFTNPDTQYIYIAIRRPMKTPSAGTEVFTMDTQGSTGDSKTPGARSPWAVDFAWWRAMDGTDPTSGNDMATRLNVPKTVASQFEFVEGTNNALGLDFNNGFTSYTTTAAQQYAWMFRRGTAFCDVVSYKGYGGNGLFYHNLTVIPEMVWIKSLNVAGGWQCGVSFGATQYIFLPLNDDNAWGLVNYNAGTGDYSGAPTATRVNTSGSINDSGTQYVAYLWATLAGVSKVGSYTGTGSDINVDCGFSAGARFILIRRTDSDGNWVYYDYLRGITVNNDPGINMNDRNAPVIANYVKPLNAGFIVTSSASADLNANGGKYTFLAIS